MHQPLEDCKGQKIELEMTKKFHHVQNSWKKKAELSKLKVPTQLLKEE